MELWICVFPQLCLCYFVDLRVSTIVVLWTYDFMGLWDCQAEMKKRALIQENQRNGLLSVCALPDRGLK